MDGLSVLEKLRDQGGATRVVVLTSYDDKAYLNRAMDLGARAYMLKDEASDSLLACLESVCAGNIYISSSFGSPRQVPHKIDTEVLSKLTRMESTVFRHVADFKTSKEIAQILNISYRTVQNHRANICKKLGLKGAHHLVQFAKEVLSGS